MPRHLIQRNGIWHYYRRVPKRFSDVDPRRFVDVSLETGDKVQAERARLTVERELETLWKALKMGGSDDARERYRGALDRARLEGFEYRPVAELAQQADLRDLLARLERLAELGALTRDAAGTAPAGGREAAEAIAGGAKMPELSLSGALDQFYALERDKLRKKSPDQVRRWKAPRLKAINNLIALVGDKPVAEITRGDALALRAWWVERVVEEGYTANSANKDIGHLAQLVDTLDDALELGTGRPFARLRLRDDKKDRRAAFSIDELLAIATEPRHLAALNADARGIVLAMVETGMRPIEICNLEPDDIALDADIPHVKVRPKANRELKTPYSEREIPLIGISLEAFIASPRGFPRYRDRSSQLSALVNKALKLRGLLPTDDHSLYSIRHTFQDRLTAVDMPDRVQTELMGHKFDRPVYGEGPTLAHKLEWLTRIAITRDSGRRANQAQGQLQLGEGDDGR